MSTTTKHLHALPFREHLNNAEKDMLRNNAYIRTFDRDSYILHSMAGEDIGLMMLVEGRIRAYLLSPDGREITLFSLPDQSICIFSALSLFCLLYTSGTVSGRVSLTLSPVPLVTSSQPSNT